MSEFTVKKMLQFPEARQATNFTCGAAATQAVLYYYGLEIREDQLVDALGVKPTTVENSGVRPLTIVRFLKKQKLDVSAKEEMTIEMLCRNVDAGVPTICSIQAWNEAYRKKKCDYSGYTDGHYVVAIGYSNEDIIFEDPSIMSNRAYIPFKEFLGRWHDQDSAGRKYEKLGIAVMGQPKFNRDLVLRIR